MIKRNPHFKQLKDHYLFPEIQQRKQQFLIKHPQASLISLGIGDTTEPVPVSVVQALMQTAEQLGTASGYTGYGSEQGIRELKEKIATKIYANRVDAEEIFISDGAKCDLGRLQLLWGPHVSIAVQDPTYPVYVEGSLLHGVREIVYMPCTPENQFFPNLNQQPRTDLIYFCSPNNPTGMAATRTQLKQLVDLAHAQRSLIIFDAAYANYIRNPECPRSIFEIEGAREVAIEVGSFSKLAGFTGIRLGWSVVPETLRYEDGSSIKADWNRLTSTVFNGASNIAQKGGCAVLEEIGLREVQRITQFYLDNAQLIRSVLEEQGCEVYGGQDAPYLWIRFRGRQSWEIFQEFLEEFHLVTTPGSGFGYHGEEFIRLSAFGHRENIECVRERLAKGVVGKLIAT